MPMLLSTCVDRLERVLGWESGYKRPKATCCKGRLQAFGLCTRVNACARHRGRGGAYESVESAARRSTKCSRVRIREAAATNYDRNKKEIFSSSPRDFQSGVQRAAAQAVAAGERAQSLRSQSSHRLSFQSKVQKAVVRVAVGRERAQSRKSQSIHRLM